jgi:membrane fusion protein (multidrug efflux system)
MRKHLITVLLFCVLLVAGCGETRQAEVEVMPVTVYVVEPSVIAETVNIPCRLESGSEAVVSVSVPGVVEDVLVLPGDTVQAGQRLMILKSDDRHRAVVSDAAATLTVARAVMDYARGNLQRAEELRETGAISINEFQRIETEAVASEASYNRAAAGYTASSSSARNGFVLAPFDGVVGRVIVSEGNMAAGPLLSISGTGMLKTELLAAPRHINKLRAGQPVVFVTDHFPGMVFPGSVVSVSEAADAVSGLVSMTAQFPDSTGSLVPGLSGVAIVSVKTMENALVVPGNMMTFTGGNTMEVALIHDGEVIIRQVETGIVNGVSYEIISGLAEGDTLINMGHTLVSEGSQVRVVQ